DVLYPTILPVDNSRDAHGKHIADWDVDCGFEGILAVGSVQGACQEVELVSGFVGHNIEGAGDCIVAEKGALRAFQDLDSIQIEESARAASRTAVINIVNEGA